jgi:hypothetical protein
MNPIVLGIGKKALDLFYKKFGKRIANTVAESKWLANTIRLLKQKAHKPKTSDVAQKVREKMLKDKPFQGFTPKVVPKKPTTLGDALKTGKHTKVPTPSHLKPPSLRKSNVIPFPKKPPHLKADGGSIDKALPKKSRDI